ncbi:uncharacterized protein N7498_010070 [Penicillium cinerascens]|uniref:Uncharacterized protein n=1 Tax=Penicillium cinerascens TaxID=70096 RepID=A0A9W9JA26_9EURO|nr:uncharacterized protein N7498_010070 [Penicillium cinerascens]KAJ5191085.1 hypothetical protein N7498_010070 [Penicillium cinerascens]
MRADDATFGDPYCIFPRVETLNGWSSKGGQNAAGFDSGLAHLILNKLWRIDPSVLVPEYDFGPSRCATRSQTKLSALGKSSPLFSPFGFRGVVVQRPGP